MTISAQIVADSINPSGNRLTTWLLRYPRCIHSELMTHRAFSRNSASSRAIPIECMIQNILDDPFIPKWSAAHHGMTVTNEIDEHYHTEAQMYWLQSLDFSVETARRLARRGLAKSVVNRLLEPWMHIEVVLSATEWNNWYALRDDPAAEPHIRELAHMMKELHATSTPRLATPTTLCPQSWDKGYELLTGTGAYAGVFTSDSVVTGGWHLPFIPQEWKIDEEDGPYMERPLVPTIKESIAHAAWVSYGNAAGKQGFTQDDVDRVYNKLVGSQPIHASPTEHVAVACVGPHRHGNFVGWCQWREFLPGQSGGDYLNRS